MAGTDFECQFEYGAAVRAFRGEEISGDRYWVRFHPEGVLFAVIDGAGHGFEAADAADASVSVLNDAPYLPPAQLLSLCHEALRLTRGAAISLASIGAQDLVMSWAGLGNVEAVLLKKGASPPFKRESLLLRNGIVGHQFSQPRVSTLPLSPGDILIFATDGIGSYFLEGISLEDSCKAIADSIMSQHAKGTDDALVLVIRIVEECP